jgi:hypothetical protein
MCELFLETLGVDHPVQILAGDIFKGGEDTFVVVSKVRLARGECCTVKTRRQEKIECFVTDVEERGSDYILAVKRLPQGESCSP